MSIEFIDQSEAVRQMGRDDRRKGLSRDAGLRFWVAGSLALRHWEEGWDQMIMNYVGLFEGISGFGLAFKRAGAKILAVCEIDKTCQSVLRRHHPEAEIISDVKEIEKERFEPGTIDILAGGFPCQDLSVAGLRKGLDGERSGLWFEFLRVITDHKPRIVVIENVPGLLSSNSGRDFAVVLRGLVECGYGVCWRVFDSQYDGVAQRRARVFIVASLGNQSCVEILFERDGSAWDSPPSREAGQDVTGTLSARTSAGGGLGTDFDLAGGLQAITGTLAASGAGSERPAGQCNELDFLITAFDARQSDVIQYGDWTGPVDTCGHSIAIATFDERNVTSKANRTTVEFGQPANTLHQGGLSVITSREVTQSLTSNYGKQPDNSDTALGPNLVMVFTERTRAEGRTLETQDELAYALTNPGSGGRTHSRQIAGQFGVRRLTPTECERLQGFPDGHTAWGYKNNSISDSARYRMLGNAVCVPTAEWIARRIMKLDCEGLTDGL